VPPVNVIVVLGWKSGAVVRVGYLGTENAGHTGVEMWTVGGWVPCQARARPHRFCAAFFWELSVLAVGGAVAEVRTGWNTKKCGTHSEGKMMHQAAWAMGSGMAHMAVIQAAMHSLAPTSQVPT